MSSIWVYLETLQDSPETRWVTELRDERAILESGQRVEELKLREVSP